MVNKIKINSNPICINHFTVLAASVMMVVMATVAIASGTGTKHPHVIIIMADDMVT